MCMKMNGVGGLSLMDDMVHAVEEQITENRWSTITSLSLHFPGISFSFLYEIVLEKLNYCKLCTRWVPKMLTEHTLAFLTQFRDQRLTNDIFELYCHQGWNVDIVHNHMHWNNNPWIGYTSMPTKKNSNRCFPLEKSCTSILEYKHFWVSFVSITCLNNSYLLQSNPRKFHQVIQNKKYRMLASGIVFIHEMSAWQYAATIQHMFIVFSHKQSNHLL